MAHEILRLPQMLYPSNSQSFNPHRDHPNARPSFYNTHTDDISRCDDSLNGFSTRTALLSESVIEIGFSPSRNFPTSIAQQQNGTKVQRGDWEEKDLVSRTEGTLSDRERGRGRGCRRLLPVVSSRALSSTADVLGKACCSRRECSGAKWGSGSVRMLLCSIRLRSICVLAPSAARKASIKLPCASSTACETRTVENLANQKSKLLSTLTGEFPKSQESQMLVDQITSPPRTFDNVK